MNTAVTILINGHPGGVVRDFDLALRHVAQAILREPHQDTFNLEQELDELFREYTIETEDGMLFPSLAHALSLRLGSGETNRFYDSIYLDLNNLDAAPGMDTSIDSYDLVNPADPNFLFALALENVASGTMDISEAAGNLEVDLLEKIGRGSINYLTSVLKHAVGRITAEAGIEVLRTNQARFGYPAGDIRNIIPAASDIRDPANFVLDFIPLTMARFWEIASKIKPETAPTP